eukprot:PLAT8645.1.p1 GENE.PLAT8645.1~~PLAT8645.1.p1  ORF type:complete len:599 (-),score=197.48 PLAT8645.1:144-1940(-)
MAQQLVLLLFLLLLVWLPAACALERGVISSAQSAWALRSMQQGVLDATMRLTAVSNGDEPLQHLQLPYAPLSRATTPSVLRLTVEGTWQHVLGVRQHSSGQLAVATVPLEPPLPSGSNTTLLLAYTMDEVLCSDDGRTFLVPSWLSSQQLPVGSSSLRICLPAQLPSLNVNATGLSDAADGAADSRSNDAKLSRVHNGSDCFQLALPSAAPQLQLVITPPLANLRSCSALTDTSRLLLLGASIIVFICCSGFAWWRRRAELENAARLRRSGGGHRRLSVGRFGEDDDAIDLDEDLQELLRRQRWQVVLNRLGTVEEGVEKGVEEDVEEGVEVGVARHAGELCTDGEGTAGVRDDSAASDDVHLIPVDDDCHRHRHDRRPRRRRSVEERASAALAVDATGMLPLNVALAYGAPHVVIARMVELAPDSCKHRSYDGWLPLNFALRNGAAVETVQLLVAAWPGSLLHADERGWLPLHLAISHGYDVQLLSTLVEAAPRSLHARTQEGWHALHMLVMRRDVSLDLLRVVAEAHEPALFARSLKRSLTPLDLARFSNEPAYYLLRSYVVWRLWLRYLWMGAVCPESRLSCLPIELLRVISQYF